MFESIQTATGLLSLDDVINYFMEEEKSNYSLFNLINQNMNEIERMMVGVNRLKDDIETVRSSVHHPIDGGRALTSSASTRSGRSEIQTMEYELIQYERHYEEFGVRINFILKLLTSVRMILQAIFNQLFETPSECLPYIPQSIVASSAGNTGTPIGLVTESNVTEYLAAIELRTDELVSQYRLLLPEMFLANRKNGIVRGSGMKGHRRSMMGGSVLGSVVLAPGTLPGSGSPVSIVQQKILSYKLPSAVDNEEMREDDSGRPLTREELRTRTMLAMQRNQEKIKARRSSSKVK
jgi:hypothetical protein